MQKGCQTTPPCPTSPHRKVVFTSLRHPCRCLLRAQVCGQAGGLYDFVRVTKSEVLLQFFTFLLLCLCFPVNSTVQQALLSLFTGQRKWGVLYCNRYYWAQGEYLHGFAEFWTIFSTSQRKKHKKQLNHQLLTVLLTALHFQAVLPHRMAAGEFHYASWSWFTARCLLFPQVPVRIFLLPLFLNGSLPTPRGPLLPCDNSLLAARSLLGKIKSTGEDEACQSFSHARQSIISFSVNT